ncbi:hypothetical protein ADICYQ_1626 [Cyclobacterium qasimii M12-11B]|uniref:Uncharacterized protein n=1 Tax=Cyclobacterium qasimii M12-11B TaxID=641524 RepID=S7VHC2_9BACT|nr:hypothetical protein ADICYQ_1626 [Cyclobacterium qasimii M12-11B]
MSGDKKNVLLILVLERVFSKSGALLQVYFICFARVTN